MSTLELPVQYLHCFRPPPLPQDDKYILKYHTCAVAGGDSGKGSEARFNPISKTSLILGRNSAVDKNIFFLINQGSSQMMELTAPSSSECKTYVCGRHYHIRSTA